jgi:UDP-N-acetylglucosamine 2-epimerase (non-hydrolysing)
MTHKIIIAVGTRPEAIKMAPVYRELRNSTAIEPVLLSTGQHREMLQQAFSAFELEPDHDLDVMEPGQTLPSLTAKVITAMSNYLNQVKPSAVIVQGDTTTVLASAIAATYCRVSVGHVEAGLRTYDMNHPFPEEMNRRLVSPLAKWSFAPTSMGKENLLREGIPAESIHVTGNTVIDALYWMRERMSARGDISHDLIQRLKIPCRFAESYLKPNAAGHPARWILVTGHRRESFGDGFESICTALLELVHRYPELGILYPVHLNPNVREPVNRLLGGKEQIALIEPVGYEDFIWLMDRCYFILSDSGGVQEEAPSLGKPVLVMRSTTERPEGIVAGTSRLVGTDVGTIVAESELLLTDRVEYQRRSALQNPYGDGQAAKKIRNILETEL